MRFQVPQFIEVEDKIFGPLSFKQFIYLVGGAGLCFIFFNFLPIYLSIFLIIPSAAFALALAFYKVNNKPFIHFVESAFKYTLSKKLYLWRKETEVRKEIEEKKEMPAASSSAFIPKLSDSKLKEMMWSLDVHSSTYSAGRKPGM